MKSDQKSSRIVVSKSRVEWKFKVRAVKKVESRKVESKSRVEKSSRIMKKFKSNRAEESLKKFKIHKFGSDKCFEK